MTRLARGPWLRWGGAALLASIVGVVLVVTSDHDSQKAVDVALVLVVGWSFVGSGLAAWSRRPDNRTGRLLVAVGFVFLAQFLSEANDPFLFTVGNAISALILAAFVHLLLSYPSGVLRSRAERRLVAIGYVTAVVANVSTLLFDGSPCNGCPRNELLVSDQPRVVNALNGFFDAAGAVIMIAVVYLLVRHYRTATRAGRRRLALIVGSGALALFLLGVAFALDAASHSASSALFTVSLAIFATVPFFFVTGLVRTRLARGGVAELLVEVRESAALEDAERGLRRVLRDPELRLGAWSPARARFVDTTGAELVEADDGRVTTIVGTESGEAVAALVHDPALLDEGELLEGAVAAARLALQRSRLQDELRGRVEELQRERDFIAAVVNAAPAFHAVLDLAGRVMRLNEPLAAAIGIDDGKTVRGRHAWEVFAVPEEAEAFGEAILSGDGEEHEHRWRGADGRSIVVAWKVQPIRDGGGNARRLLSGIDVTERTRQEEALRRQRDFLSAIGDATPSLLCIVDAEGTIGRDGVNRAFRDATGSDAEASFGRVFWDVAVEPEEVDGVRAAFLEAVATGESRHVETRWRSGDGRPLLVEWWTVSLAPAREGMYLVSGLDVTERALQAEEIRRSRARLVEAGDAERRRLERNLHDGAQQRLVSLSLALRLAQSRVVSDPDGASELLASAGEELALALQELRELARGLHPAVLADRGLAPALASLAERSAIPVELDVDVAERLPPAVEVATFYVVSEALANVAKYAHATSASVRVRREGSGVLAEVADDGIGGADPAQGSGLRGLVDRVDSVDGTLEVWSPPGGGTRIVAAIPLEPVRSAVPQDAG
jgi:PAS domain S-box-containing protein